MNTSGQNASYGIFIESPSFFCLILELSKSISVERTLFPQGKKRSSKSWLNVVKKEMKLKLIWGAEGEQLEKKWRLMV